MNKNKTILVTGGAGFIGSHLCERLIKEGYRVVCFDNLASGSKKNVSHLTKKELIFVEGDANKFSDLEPVFKKYKPISIFHYAAVVGVKRTNEDPISTLVDIKGTMNIANLALDYGKPKIIFSSSSEVYGEPVEIPETENGHINPQIPYAVSKLFSEKLLKSYWEKYRLPSCSLRFFNVYGPRQESSDYGFVVGIFIRNVLKNKSPVIFGDGSQTRDFVYIDDNIEASIKAFKSDKSNGEVINVGRGMPVTIFDLAESIIEKSGKKGLKLEFSSPRDDIKHRFPDVSKMRELLNFRPQISLDEGLEKTIDWYRQQEDN